MKTNSLKIKTETLFPLFMKVEENNNNVILFCIMMWNTFNIE